LLQLLQNKNIPESAKSQLTSQFEQVEAMYQRLCEGTLHIAAFGRVSSGKSSLLNALLGKEVFTVSPIHGSTTTANLDQWQSGEGHGVFLIDTPGINEVDGEQREQLAKDVCARSDLIIFVADGDLTEDEFSALQYIVQLQRPVVLAINKSDRLDDHSKQVLLQHLQASVADFIPPQNVIHCAARPIAGEPDIKELTQRLWTIINEEGKSLLALNAALFADQLGQEITSKVMLMRKDLSEQVIRNWSLGKGIAVAVNPIPLADLFAAASMDIGLVIHLAHIYGITMNKTEAGKLVLTISAQLAVLMGAVWGVNLASSALKTASAGLSTVITAGTQGALAYYATYVVGVAALKYFAAGGNWGQEGAKKTIHDIIAQLDKKSIMAHAKADIQNKLDS